MGVEQTGGCPNIDRCGFIAEVRKREEQLLEQHIAAENDSDHPDWGVHNGPLIYQPRDLSQCPKSEPASCWRQAHEGAPETPAKTQDEMYLMFNVKKGPMIIKNGRVSRHVDSSYVSGGDQ